MIAKALLRWDPKLNQKENKQLGEKGKIGFILLWDWRK